MNNYWGVGSSNWNVGPKPTPVPAAAPPMPNFGGMNVPGLDLGQYKPFGGKKDMGDSQDIAKLLSSGFMPLLLQQLQLAYKFQPQRDKLTNNALNALSPERRQAMIDKFRNTALSNARRGSAQQGASLKSQGFGDALTGGLALDASNRAETMTGDFAAQMFSPEFDLQSAMQGLGVLDGAQGIPALQQMLGLLSAGQRPPEPDKPTFLESILGIGASFLPF